MNILNKKINEIKKVIHMSYRAMWLRALCHMTSMTRRHGNNKAIRSKITVAKKKKNSRWGLS